MANFGGFLQALGQAFGGYGQDQQTRFARNQALQRMGLEQRSADDAHTTALLERATNYPLLGPNGQSSLPTLPGMENFPTGSVDVPGYGTVDPFGKLRLSTWAEGLKRRLDTNEQIRKDQETGVVDRNRAETSRANAEADPEFAGKKAGAEEAAKFPWLKKLEDARFSNQNQLQNNRFGFEQDQQSRQHAFEEGQQGRQFSYDADKAARELAGNFANQSALEYQRQGNGLYSKSFRDAPSRRAPSQAFMPLPTNTQGAPPSPTAPDAKPPLADRILQLKAQGLTKDRARLQLRREGYDLAGVP